MKNRLLVSAALVLTPILAHAQTATAPDAPAAPLPMPEDVKTPATPTMETPIAPDTASAATASYNAGYAALQGGNLASAAENFAKVLALTPNDAQAEMLLGYVRLKQGFYDEAIASLQNADAKGTKLDARARAIIQNNIGMAYWNQKQYARALPAYERAVALDENYTDARYNLAFALLAQNRAKEALPLFTILTTKNPRDPMLQDGLGQSLEALSDWPKAFAAYKRAIALNGKDSSYPLNLGLALLRSDPAGAISGRRDLAIGFLRDATRLNPQGAPAFLQLGLLLIDKKRWPEAQDTLQRYRALKPDDFLGAFNLALAHDYAGNFDQALKLYGEAETMMPGDAAVKNNVGRIYLKRKLYDGAIEQFQKALLIDGNSSDARNNLALALAAKKDFVASNTEWRKLIALTRSEMERNPPVTPRAELQARLLSARAALAENLRNDGKFAEAASEYKNIVVASPTNTVAWSNLGLALYRTKDLPGALKAYDDLLRRDPKNAIAHNNRGVVLEAQNKRAEALVAFRKAVALRPDYAEAKANRDRLLAATVVS